MPNMSIKRFDWVRSPSVWQQTQAWRARQQELRDNFEAANSAASSAFASASANLVTGTASIVTNMAAQRIRRERVAASLNTLV
jgi:hypothetical protein